MIHWLARVYRRIGIHTAPPGTLLHGLHATAYVLVRRKSLRFASEASYTRKEFGAVPYYDVARLRRLRSVDGLALIFFMGVGDYLMATPFIRALHLAHPDLPIYAYATSNSDNVSSGLVIELLKANPFIHRVFTYKGRARDVWTKYDYQDALAQIPEHFLILPVIYDVEPRVVHRVTSLLETFSLPVDLPLPNPIAYQTKMSSTASEILSLIHERIASTAPVRIVCLQLSTRSSGYDYPYANQLASDLAKRGNLVISFTPTECVLENVIDIDVSTITPTDTIELLRSLKQLPEKSVIISVNSLLWPISASLGITNLGLHVFQDPSIHQYHYPNIFVVTRYIYERLSPFHVFRTPPDGYHQRLSPDGATLFTDIRPGFVLNALEEMLARLGAA